MQPKLTRRKSVIFAETQRFSQWWLWLLFIALGLLPMYMIYKQLILGIPVGQKPMPDAGVIVFALFIYALILFLATIRLSTEITNTEIRLRFFPFIKMTLKWDDVATARIVDYGFVGGWGIRLGTKYGTVYNIWGRLGMAIEMKNHRRYCIGTQRSQDLKRVLLKYGFSKE
jgi:hypothetical protein